MRRRLFEPGRAAAADAQRPVLVVTVSTAGDLIQSHADEIAAMLRGKIERHFGPGSAPAR